MQELLTRIGQCTVCAPHLSHGPRPVVSASPQSRILLIGQAPGTRVHASGIPWDDPSGKRLRQWLEVDDATFYEPDNIALVPMGFCYPGKGTSGDLPPRKECAPLWHGPLLDNMPSIQLTLLVGQYAQRYYLGDKVGKNLTETVRQFADYLPENVIPLPHPSPRNRFWLQKNPWFAHDLLPILAAKVEEALQIN